VRVCSEGTTQVPNATAMPPHGRTDGCRANDIRELENLDRIPAEEDGGNLYLVNGNMVPLTLSWRVPMLQIQPMMTERRTIPMKNPKKKFWGWKNQTDEDGTQERSA
jgi:hypothetical protein